MLPRHQVGVLPRHQVGVAPHKDENGLKEWIRNKLKALASLLG